MNPEAGLQLLRPGHLAVALVALPLVAVALYGRAARRRERARLVAPRHAGRFLPGHSEGRGLARIALAAAALGFLGLALSGPVRGYTVRHVSRRGLDLVVCIDTSKSMLVRDLRPDRLSRAVREVRGLIDRLRGDRVALIAFSGDAREVAPLTHDRTTLAELLERVTPEDNLVGGTDLGAALTAALSMFDGRTGAHEAVVLLTDGEDLAGKGLEVARTAAERGIRVYVVGMGTETGGKIPVVDAQGAERFLADDSGEEVVSALSSSSLEQLAHVTGGEYLSATRSAAPLEELYQMRISRLEGRRMDGTEWVPHDRFQWALVPALVCMLLAAGMRERSRVRGERAARRGARAEPRPVRAAGLLLLLPLGPAGPWLPREREAGERLAELEQSSLAGEHERALELAAELLAAPALAAAPEVERARVQYAVGVARERAGEREAAIDAFRRARDLAGPGELREDAVYNVGAVLLEAAEAVRATIPEISGEPPAAPLAPLPPGGPPVAGGAGGGPGAGPAGEPQGPDPLDVAEAAYRAARGAHLDRVRLGAPDGDTRANLELIQRRLRELEEIRRQREEEQQEQQDDQQQDQQQQEDQQDRDSEQQQDQQSPEDQEPQDQQPPDQEPQDSEQQDEQPEPQEPEPQEGQDQDDAESSDEQEPEQEPQARPAQEEERMMTREELQRLMDQLSEIEEEAQRVAEMLTRRRRVQVEKDW